MRHVVVQVILVLVLLGFVAVGAWFLLRASSGRRR
jgi:hypothetical protein